MSSLPMEAAAAEAVRAPRELARDVRARTAETTPGILEALGYTGDALDRVEHAIDDRLAGSIARLEDRLMVVTRQTPPSMRAESPGPRSTGPASDESSVTAQQVNTLGNRALNAHDRIAELAEHLDDLARRVDLA